MQVAVNNERSNDMKTTKYLVVSEQGVVAVVEAHDTSEAGDIFNAAKLGGDAVRFLNLNELENAYYHLGRVTESTTGVLRVFGAVVI